MTSFADHFSGHAAQYATFRPSYPRELLAFVADLTPARDLAWDCGTGNGQAALLIAEHFARVVATDASASQLSHAPAHPRIQYRVAAEDDSGQAPASVDLVTVAQALHWFDLQRFYGEVRRVLKPGAVIAVWSYDLVRIAPEIDALVDEFYRTRVGRYWLPERHHVETGYRDLPFPFEGLDGGNWASTGSLSVRELEGYIGTWSAVARAKGAEGVDPVAELTPQLRRAWGTHDERRPATWPLHLRIGRRAERDPA